MLAHELRNPLAPILNALLLLRAGEAEPVRHRMGRRGSSSARSAT